MEKNEIIVLGSILIIGALAFLVGYQVGINIATDYYADNQGNCLQFAFTGYDNNDLYLPSINLSMDTIR